MLHRMILKSRHRAYDRGRRKVVSAELPTVCIGNVTVGGTGKTPHTEMILRMLQQSHPELKPAVLSRGYGRKTKGYLDVDPEGNAISFGDEPLQIAKKFRKVHVAVDKNRVRGCARLKEAGEDLVILDDAFQYRKLKADLNIVLVDWNRPVFRDRLIPFGSLRDLPERIFKADVLIVTKCPTGLTDAEKGSFCVKTKLSDFDPAKCSAVTPQGRKILLLFTSIRYLPPVPVFPEGDTRYLYSKHAILFSGIAKDGPLKRHVMCDYKLIRNFSFPDHHNFTKKDVTKLLKAHEQHPTASFITTEKDVERVMQLKTFPKELRERLLAIPIEVEFSSDREREFLLGRIESLR